MGHERRDLALMERVTRTTTQCKQSELSVPFSAPILHLSHCFNQSGECGVPRKGAIVLRGGQGG